MIHIGLLDIWQCKIIAFCIIFCLCLILSSFCVLILPPVDSVYWFHMVIILLNHIIFPLLCRVHVEWIFYSKVNSFHWKLCWVQFVWTLICTLCSHPVLGWLYQGRGLGTDQIWQSYMGIHDILQRASRGTHYIILQRKNMQMMG